MCYYSTTLRRSQVRDAKEGEDLVLREDGVGHHLPIASDGKVVCMVSGSEVHIANLQLSENAPRVLRFDLAVLIGQPVSARFREYGHSHGHAADRIVIAGHEVHFIYLAPGTKFYTGPKRAERDLDKALGMDQLRVPSVSDVEAVVAPRPLVTIG